MHGIYPVLSVPQSHAFAAGTRHRSNMAGFITPRRNAGIHHPPRTGLPLYSVRISLFVTYTPVWNWWSRLQFGLAQRRDGNSPTTLRTSTHVFCTSPPFHLNQRSDCT